MDMALIFPNQTMEKNLHESRSKLSQNTKSLVMFMKSHEAKIICIYNLPTPFEDFQKHF